MKDFKNILLTTNSTVKEALNIINKGSMRIALVVKDGKLKGVVSDADVRRAMLDGISIEDNIGAIFNKNPFTCYANDAKEDIVAKAIEKNIYEIPIVDDENNLIGFETLTHLLKPKTHSNKVVLMVGGLGTRLRPLTESTPKPMLKVGDKPILETIVQNFKKYGYKNIILSVSYRSGVIEDYFGDGSKFGVSIEYVHEEKKMGTAGALGLIKEKLKEPFFVMNGDLLTNINFENMMNYHKQNSADATMGVREYGFQVPYGVVNVDGIDIKNIEEKPTYNFFVSGGIYILNPEILEYVPNNKYLDMPTLFENIIKHDRKSISFPIREYWLDIGRMEEFKKANEEYGKVF